MEYRSEVCATSWERGDKDQKCSGPLIKNLHYKDRKYRIMQ